MLKKILKIILHFCGLDEITWLYRLRNEALTDCGWIKSNKFKQPLDLKGLPLPWMTYASIFFIETRLNCNMTVFEYGSGNSTLWWAARVKKICSCEHNIEWYNNIKVKLPVNAQILYCEQNKDYSKAAINSNEKYEVLVIDGIDRNNCAFNALKSLKENGIIVWDNSDVKEYEPGINFLMENGYKKIDFWGIGPLMNSFWMTSIFYKNNNCFNL